MPRPVPTLLALALMTAMTGFGACSRADKPVDADADAPVSVATDAFGFAGVFTNHMVLQRGEPITIWGTAPVDAQVEISFDGTVQTAEASDTGAWSSVFPAKTAGGPYEISISSDKEPTKTITDVLIGDVFLCSGQSNMEMKVNRVRSASGEINREHSPDIRQYHPRYKVNPTPLREFHEPQDWVVASKDTVGEFSAVCYFFAKELHKTNPVPIGLLHSSWGGAQIQAWMRQEDLRPFEGMDESMDVLNIYAEDEAAGIAALGAQWENWYTRESSGHTPWATLPADATGWSALPDFKSWKQYGDSALANFDGLVWYRNSVTLTEAQAQGGGEFSFGKLSKGDIAWINGQFVGRSVGWEPRTYSVGAEHLQAGVNHILINVRSMWGAGGMMGPVEEIGFTPTDGDMIAMPEGWEYKKEPYGIRMAPLIPWQTMAGYTGMHNAMIAPLTGLKFKGAVWYQGESNTRRDKEYDEMLAAMISNWRDMFGANMPVVVVQLPEFGAEPTEPTESTWSNLREAQRLTAMRDPNIGLAVTMGLGNPADIHPTEKQKVGQRVARVYRGLIGDTDADTLGFAPKRAYRRGDTVRVEMTAPENGFITRSADHPIAVELCGGSPLKCVYATTTLEHNTMVLTSGSMTNPTRVRYCWGNAPTCNLFSADGLPAGPFEITIEP